MITDMVVINKSRARASKPRPVALVGSFLAPPIITWHLILPHSVAHFLLRRINFTKHFKPTFLHEEDDSRCTCHAYHPRACNTYVLPTGRILSSIRASTQHRLRLWVDHLGMVISPTHPQYSLSGIERPYLLATQSVTAG